MIMPRYLAMTMMNYGFTEPYGFIGGVCLSWDSYKAFLVSHKFGSMHITFVVKATMPYL